MNIITRKEANEKGLKRYFTGKLCIRGNIAERYPNGNCLCEDCQVLKREITHKWNVGPRIEYRKANRKELNKKRRMVYAKNPRKVLKAVHKWRKDNPEKAKEIQQKWRESNKEKAKECQQKWQKNNPGRISHHVSLRRARKKGAAGSHTLEEWRMLKILHGYKCAICGKEKKLTRDHIIPLTRGGSDCIENIQPLCKSCNSRKGTKFMSELELSIF